MMPDNLIELERKTTVNFVLGGFNPFEKYARQIGSFPQFSG